MDRVRQAASITLLGAALLSYAVSVYLAYTGYIAASLVSAAIGSVLLLTGADLLKE